MKMRMHKVSFDKNHCSHCLKKKGRERKEIKRRQMSAVEAGRREEKGKGRKKTGAFVAGNIQW